MASAHAPHSRCTAGPTRPPGAPSLGITRYPHRLWGRRRGGVSRRPVGSPEASAGAQPRRANSEPHRRGPLRSHRGQPRGAVCGLRAPPPAADGVAGATPGAAPQSPAGRCGTAPTRRSTTAGRPKQRPWEAAAFEGPTRRWRWRAACVRCGRASNRLPLSRAPAHAAREAGTT